MSVSTLHRLRWASLVNRVLPDNRFYAAKFAGLDLHVENFAALPFTTKAELVADQAQHPPFGTALGMPPAAYTRLHQSSGTSTGRPLRWLDSHASWPWLLECWRQSFPLMGLTKEDRAFFPFSFGPFLGFWSAFEAVAALGCFVVPGGGLSSTTRLDMLRDLGITAVFATPTYALHLAELAQAAGFDLAAAGVRKVVVAGEPGGCIPATRERIEAVWGARVFDHYGLTEVGPLAVELEAEPLSMVLLEGDYIFEVLEPGGSAAVEPGELGELVVTNLGRVDSPLIRYRTGDLVRIDPDPAEILDLPPNARDWRRIKGGVVGRADDMLHVRGNNLYPSAVEAVVRRFPAAAEFRVVIDQSGPLADLRVEVEPAPGADGAELAGRVARALKDALLFRVQVEAVPPGSLPRFEHKARRVVKIP